MEVRQRVALGALGACYLALRGLASRCQATHVALRDHQAILRWNRGVACSLSDLLGGINAGTERLIALVDEFRAHDQSNTRTASFHMNRLMHAISDEIARAVRATNEGASSTRDLRETIYVEQDVAPVLRAQLESVLHNHMLRELV